jgi:hypothetical protein
MPAHSEDQAKLMRIVKAIQNKDVKASDYSDPAKTMAKQMDPADVEDMMTTEEIQKLKEHIRKTIREINTTANVQGYETPNAFSKRGNEKSKAKKQADLTGYSVVNEITEKQIEQMLSATEVGDKIEITDDDGKKSIFQRVGTDSKRQPTFKYIKNNKPSGTASALASHAIKKVKPLTENRWLELKKEEAPARAKIGRGISNINKQLNEMERFLNWYSRLKTENNVTNEQFWKRTNHNILKIKERMVRLENILRKISE